MSAIRNGSARLLVIAAALLGVLALPAIAADAPPNPPAAVGSVVGPAAATGGDATAGLVPPGGPHSGALFQVHIGAGLNCASCHKESPPATPVATSQCLSCHVSYEALAQQSGNLGEANPHASHQGELPCESCHRIHQPSVDFCAQCHQWGFKVP